MEKSELIEVALECNMSSLDLSFIGMVLLRQANSGVIVDEYELMGTEARIRRCIRSLFTAANLINGSSSALSEEKERT